MTTTPVLTRQQAQDALAALKAAHARVIEPRDHAGHEYDPSLTGADLEAHLHEAHYFDADMLARKHAKGMTTAEVHAAEHKPEAVYPEPVLVEDYTEAGHWAIAWEEGPYEWCYGTGGGVVDDETRALYDLADAEFGTTTEPPKSPKVEWPKGVYAEPIMSFVMGLYPD